MKTYSVGEITKYIGFMFTQDFVLKNVKVTGEISNCKYHQAGHIYFTLKDDNAQIPCTCFRSDASRLKFRLENGTQVEIEGRIEVYEKGGYYALYARQISKAGVGDLFARFEALKLELEERGMFSNEYKQPIPKYVRTLGVVTAPAGAAVRDIIDIAKRRNPGIQIILYPALVQGEGAAESIVRGIEALNSYKADCIIVGRGGGSMEDLWAFNEEIVAQAIFDSSVPIISAVGHETDFTIADFVADLRAPTPSAAAEIAVYEASRIASEIGTLQDRLGNYMDHHIREARSRSDKYGIKLKSLSPVNQVTQKRTYLMKLEEDLFSAMQDRIKDKRHRLDVYITRMKGLSPLDKLNKGYLVAVDESGKRIRSTNDVKKDDSIKLYVSDGYVKTSVTDIHTDSSTG